jgi:hypothetical protein
VPAIFFDTSTQLAGAATFIGGTAGNGGVAGIGGATGQARDLGSAVNGNGGEMARFGAVVNTDQAGNLFIDGSFDGSTWRQQGTIAAVVGGSADISVPLRFRYYRVRYVNGATPTGVGNFAIHSSFTAI